MREQPNTILNSPRRGILRVASTLRAVAASLPLVAVAVSPLLFAGDLSAQTPLSVGRTLSGSLLRGRHRALHLRGRRGLLRARRGRSGFRRHRRASARTRRRDALGQLFRTGPRRGALCGAPTRSRRLHGRADPRGGRVRRLHHHPASPRAARDRPGEAHRPAHGPLRRRGIARRGRAGLARRRDTVLQGLRHGQPGVRHPVRHRHAHQHRVDLQAVHRLRRHAAGRARAALAGRRHPQTHPGAARVRPHHHRAPSRHAYLRAARVPEPDAHDRAAPRPRRLDRPLRDHRHRPAPARAPERARRRVQLQQHRLRAGRGHRRAHLGPGLPHLHARERLRAAGDDPHPGPAIAHPHRPGDVGGLHARSRRLPADRRPGRRGGCRRHVLHAGRPADLGGELRESAARQRRDIRGDDDVLRPVRRRRDRLRLRPLRRRAARPQAGVPRGRGRRAPLDAGLVPGDQRGHHNPEQSRGLQQRGGVRAGRGIFRGCHGA